MDERKDKDACMIRHRSAAGHGIGRRPAWGWRPAMLTTPSLGRLRCTPIWVPSASTSSTADDLGPDPKASARRRITDAGIVNPPHSQFTPSIEPRRSMSRWAATCAAKRSMEAVSAPASGSEPAAALTTLAGKPAASLN